ncbi:TM2 domain-containing protein [Alloscardovia omnicolens]|uniref:TM2 domain-containing protein n=1 Tax=Alloscardovia omnicolens TaxID=419015 RepID=UPI000C75A6AE|nr:TM2 domain-containing protein [Alloscardovia omnicolens]PKY78576.1 TM2 domain-containing protein [Alloscardovia omnicolens]
MSNEPYEQFGQDESVYPHNADNTVNSEFNGDSVANDANAGAPAAQAYAQPHPQVQPAQAPSQVYEQQPYVQAQPQYAQPVQPQYTQPTQQAPYVQQASYGQQAPYGQPQPQQQAPYGQYVPPQFNNGVPNAGTPGVSGVPGAFPQAQPLMVGSKSKIVAAVLAFFLGALGIHNFYLGKTTRAIVQLLMTVVGWILILPPIICGIWAFVEFILILVSSPGSSYHKDGYGLELQD